LSSATGNGRSITRGNSMKIIVESDSDQRLDKWLPEHMKNCSRTYIRKLIKHGLVTIGGVPANCNSTLRKNDEILIAPANMQAQPIMPQNIPLSIIYEDSDIIVIDKPKGMAVSPSLKASKGTVVNSLYYHSESLCQGRAVTQPGLVHSMEKGTSGILLVCKTDAAQEAMHRQFADRLVNRSYLCIVHGRLIDDKGILEDRTILNPVTKKPFRTLSNNSSFTTSYSVRERFDEYTFVEAIPDTSSIQQLRYQFSRALHPLICDSSFGHAPKLSRFRGQCIHVCKMSFYHPVTGQRMEFSTDPEIPDYMAGLLSSMKDRSFRYSNVFGKGKDYDYSPLDRSLRERIGVIDEESSFPEYVRNAANGKIQQNEIYSSAPNPILCGLQGGRRLKYLIITDRFYCGELALKARGLQKDFPCYVYSQRAITGFRGELNRYGCIGVFDKTQMTDIEPLLSSSQSIGILDQAVTEASYGRLIRTLASLGADSVIFTKESNIRTIRKKIVSGSVGYVLQIPCVFADCDRDTLFAKLRSHGFSLVSLVRSETAGSMGKLITPDQIEELKGRKLSIILNKELYMKYDCPDCDYRFYLPEGRLHGFGYEMDCSISIFHLLKAFGNRS